MEEKDFEGLETGDVLWSESSMDAVEEDEIPYPVVFLTRTHGQFQVALKRTGEIMDLPGRSLYRTEKDALNELVLRLHNRINSLTDQVCGYERRVKEINAEALKGCGG